MALLSQQANTGQPKGDFAWDVGGTYFCGGIPQTIVYDNSLLAQGLGEGRWVALKASAIDQYAGTYVTPPSGYYVYSVSRENVNFPIDGTKDCIVVTLVKL